MPKAGENGPLNDILYHLKTPPHSRFAKFESPLPSFESSHTYIAQKHRFEETFPSVPKKKRAGFGGGGKTQPFVSCRFLGGFTLQAAPSITLTEGANKFGGFLYYPIFQMYLATHHFEGEPAPPNLDGLLKKQRPLQSHPAIIHQLSHLRLL